MSEPGAMAAATLVLFRTTPQAGADAPEVLFVERSRAMAFAGGALVFPGGRVDPGDHALALELGGATDERDAEDIAARIAAIRETLEEVGIAIGLPPLSPHVLGEVRAALHSGRDFGAVLAAHRLTLDPHALTLFARWRPVHPLARVFDTRFYLAELPGGAPAPAIDATENVRMLWATAQAAIDLADAGEARIIFPTRRNLERIAQFPSFADVVAHARATPLRTVTPWVEPRGGVDHLCIPDDLGYPVTSEPLTGAMRG